MLNEDCLFCQKQKKDHQLNFTNLLNTALYLKYTEQNEYDIDDLIKHKSKKWVIDYHESLLDDGESYLKRMYTETEIPNKLAIYVEYYKYRLDTPRLHMKSMFNLIDKYQKSKKEIHYQQVKIRLGLIKPNYRIKTELVEPSNLLGSLLEPMVDNDTSRTLLQLLQKMEYKAVPILVNKPSRMYTQPSVPTLKSNIILKNHQSTQKLKQILAIETTQKKLIPRSPYKTISQTSLNQHKQQKVQQPISTSGRTTINNPIAYKSPTKKNRVLVKNVSQPDLIQSIYVTQKSVRNSSHIGQHRRITHLFQK